MRFDCVLLDFDGTLTLAEECGAPYLAAYREDFGRRIGRDVAAEWRVAEARVRARPSEYGWLFEGRIVAPGDADPYIRASTVARALLDDFGLYSDPSEREQFLGELYAVNYALSATVFRPGAREVLTRLLASGVPIFVVTNSLGNVVRQKLESLLDNGHRPGVRGNAQKAFVREAAELDPAFGGLPETQRLEGLDRPVYLRRGAYYEVLRSIWNETGAARDRTLLVGDIYELDLAMPHHLGVSIHLVLGERTPAYERRFVESAERGGVSHDLGGVLARVGLA